MIKKCILTALLVFLFQNAYFQSTTGYIEGRVFDSKNNEPLPFVTIAIYGTTIGSTSDLDGKFIFAGIKPGYVQLIVTSVGYEQYISEEFLVTNANRVYLDIPLKQANINLEEIVIKASPFRRKEESPLSIRRIGIAEIEKNPGGNRDISKVIRSFPGVASTPAYRNDVIVRGGGPGENVFYLDGVEIPNLNHFSTQGASGGPVGIINVDFVREVDFYSGAFPANRGNTLSSVLEFNQIDGNKDKIKFKGTIGASDLSLTLDGPIAEKSTYIFSVRRSYLQLLFSAIGLPFLPTYNDFQFKVRTRFDKKNELTLIGLGAVDQFKLNLQANKTNEQRFILSYLPVNEQWNYTIGAIFRRYHDNGYDIYVLSRNYLNNISYKHLQNNISLPRTYDYSSDEAENKFRFEHTAIVRNSMRINAGLGLEQGTYTNNTASSRFINDSLFEIRYTSELDIFNYNIFGQTSIKFFNDRLSSSFGLRMDGSSYSEKMSNPFRYLSPRFSLSYIIGDKTYLNFNTGRYYQRPPYTALGYRDNNGQLINKKNGISYILSDQLVAGIEYQPNINTIITFEAFYKWYSDYPFSVADSVALANKGADYGTYGDEELLPISDGRAYGFEIYGRALNLFGFNTIFSYTYVRSEFKNLTQAIIKDKYIPSKWDNRHIFNLTATKSFKRNWDFGFKWRFVGGSPYTPYDTVKTAIKSAWDAQGTPYLNYSRFNQLRSKAFHQLDIRIDKQYFFNKWSFRFYLDIQNVYNFKVFEPDRPVRESILNPETNDIYVDNGIENYRLGYIKSDGSGILLPTVGIIVEF